MSGMAITPVGANFAPYRVGIDLTVKGSVEGLFLFGGTAEDSAKNWAKDKPNGLWTGTPAVLAGEAAFDPASAYLTTGIADATSMTIIQAVRSDQVLGSGQNDPYFSSTANGLSVAGGRAIFGVSMRIEANTGALTLFVPRFTGSVSADQTTGLSPANSPPMTEWSIIAARFNDTSQVVDDVLRAKTLAAAAVNPRDRTINTLRIGARYGNATGIGPSRQAGAIIYSRYLMDVELVAAAAQLRALIEQRGITFP